MQTASRLRSPSGSPKARVNPLRASALGKPSAAPIPSNVTPVRRTQPRGPVPMNNTNRSSSASPNRIPTGPKSPSFSTPVRRSSPTGVSTSVAGRLTSTPVLQRLIVEDDEVRVDDDVFEVGSDRSPAVGGAVGLWKLSREVGGNSPTRLRSPNVEEPVVSASTPLVRGIRDASRAASEALTYSPHRVGPTSTTVNSSLDTAKMGSILHPPPTAPTSSQRSMDGLTPASRAVATSSSSITSVSKAAKRPNTFATAPRGLLIPPLELPTYNIATTTSSLDGSPSTTEHHTRQPGWVTVVFDLDETLCNNRRMGKAALRPGCMELLHRLAKIRDDPEANCFIEIILWTASMECVARPVTDGMDPNGTLFNHCVFRDRRWYKEVGYTKDLRLLGRDLSHVVIIENSPQSVVLNRRHAILVKDYVGHGPNATTIGGYSSFLGRYFSGNSATATASPTDPSLYIVADILCDWARSVGESAKTIVPRAPTGFNHIHSTLDPGCVPLPSALGIVEFLRTRRDMNTSNEVVIDATNRHLGGEGASPQGVVGRAPQRAASSPAMGAPRRGGYAVGRWRRGM